MAFSLALAAALLGSIAVIIESHLVREKNPNAVSAASRLAYGAFLNVIFLAIILFLQPETFWFQPIAATAIILLAIGILDMLYNYFYLKALEKEAASKVTPIVSLHPIFTLLVSSFLPGIANTSTIILIVLLVVTGVYLLSLEHVSFRHPETLFAPFRTRIFKLAICAAIFTGVASVLIDIALAHGYTSEITLLFVRMLIIGLITYGAFRPAMFPAHYTKSSWLLLLFLIEFLYVIERIAQTYAIGLGNVSLVVAIISVSPFFVLLFDRVFLKEPITINKSIGTLLVIAGVVLAATL